MNSNCHFRKLFSLFLSCIYNESTGINLMLWLQEIETINSKLDMSMTVNGSTPSASLHQKLDDYINEENKRIFYATIPVIKFMC